MPKTFQVSVKANLPYPIERQYRITASSLAPVANRAIKLFRKDKPGKKIEEIYLKITALKGIN